MKIAVSEQVRSVTREIIEPIHKIRKTDASILRSLEILAIEDSQDEVQHLIDDPNHMDQEKHKKNNSLKELKIPKDRNSASPCRE